MLIDKDRGKGRTTKQLIAAPRGAVFVWCNDHLGYPKALAEKLDRTDIEIVGPSWLSDRRWQGRELTGLVLDHAIFLNAALLEGYQGAITRVRKMARA